LHHLEVAALHHGRNYIISKPKTTSSVAPERTNEKLPSILGAWTCRAPISCLFRYSEHGSIGRDPRVEILLRREVAMAKSQLRGNREAKKPKKVKPKVTAASPPSITKLAEEARKK
jgi:hypothetical protein